MHLDFGQVEFNVQPSDTRRSYNKDLQVTKICTGLNKFKILSASCIWYEGHFINNAHHFFIYTYIFFRKYHFTILLCNPPASQWPRPNILEDLLFHLGYHFCSILGWFGYPLLKPLPWRENCVHAWAFLTCGISRRPMDSCLDWMVREVTLTTRIYLANRSQTSPGAGVHCRAKWVTHPRVSQVSFWAFFCSIFAASHNNMLLSHMFHMEPYLSWWFLGNHKQRSSFAWPLIALVEILWVAGRMDFSTRLTAISIPVQSL
jgi:hypothetical protein